MGLRLGIDGDALRKPLTGVGRYVFGLCVELEAALPDDTKFFVYSRLGPAELELPSARFQLRQETKRWLRKLPSFVWLKTRAFSLCEQDRLDVFWAGRTLHPRLPHPTRTVCTVHDLNHILVPETMQKAGLISARLWFRGDLMHADSVVANSNGTAQRLQQHLQIATNQVVHPAVDSKFRPLTAGERESAEGALRKIGVRSPYLLSVSTFEPRKNLPMLLRAFVKLREAGTVPDHQLVVVGPKGWGKEMTDGDLERAQRNGVLMPGYVSNELLPILFARADLLLMPSLYEGFGMPVLEARACGTPSVFTDIPELREAAGAHGHAVRATEEGLSQGIVQALRTVTSGDVESEKAKLCQGLPTWAQGAERLAAELVPLDDSTSANRSTRSTLRKGPC